MRQEQREKLQQLQDKLIDVALEEATPDDWPGHNMTAQEMDSKTRGDRYWCKKNAVATLSLVQRIDAIIGRTQQSLASTFNQEDASLLDAEVQSAEREASKLLDQMTRTAKKQAFDSHTHGKR